MSLMSYDGDSGTDYGAEGATQEVGTEIGEYQSSEQEAQYSDRGLEQQENIPGDYQNSQQDNTRARSARRNSKSKQSDEGLKAKEEALDGLPQHVLDIFAKYDHDATKLAEAYISATSALSKRYESFTEDDWKLFFDANDKINDIPATKSGYDIQFNPVKEGHQDMLGDAWKENIAILGQQAGLNRQQANAIYNFLNYIHNEEAIHSQNQVAAYKKEQHKALKKAWGKTYDLQLARANVGIDVWAELIDVPREEILNDIQSVGAENNARFLQLLAILGGEGGETPNTQAFGSNMTPRSAAIRFSEIRNDHQKMSILASPWHPLHKQVVEEVNMLANKKNNY